MAAAKSTKKRVASTNPGPAKKKAHLDKSIAEKRVQRKVPVTNARIEEESESSEGEEDEDEEEEWAGTGSDGGDFEDVEEGEAEFEDTDEEAKENKDDMDVDHTSSKPSREDGKSSREAHKLQKAVHQERKAAKQHADVLVAAKPLWARARRKQATPAERQKDIEALMEVVRGRVQDVVFKHDASRVVQTLVKYGSQRVRDEVAAELKGRYRDLVQNKYSKFLVTKLIRQCPSHRTSILLEFRGHVVRLLLHREASSVLADAFELYSNAFERSLLVHDFYGKEVALFSPAISKGAAADEKDKAVLKKGLAGALEGADTERRKRILAAVKENLELIMNNPDKGAISHAIFHRALLEYLLQVNELDDEALQEKLRREIFEACQEQLAEMVHTKDGSRVVREFIAWGTAKDRKQVVKVLKPHVERICKDEEAQNVLFTALDVIDDTKLTAKSLVSEITSRAMDLYNSPQGRRALLYLLVPRVTRHFTPAQCALLAETDSIRAKTSKKDVAVRREEILKAASPSLIALLDERNNAETLVRDPGGSLLVTEVMLYAEGDKAKATASLIALLNEPYPSSDSSKQHVIDVPHSSRVYKTLLQGGHFSHSTRTVARVPESVFSPAKFATAWMKDVDRERTCAMGLGGGTFVIAALVERLNEEGGKGEKDALKSWFGEGYVKRLRESEVKGKKVLLDALGS
ncbi:ARM repeat-containing protein [Fomitiporia mediterranea MF3/22]|uniref:ARM repeat-containing protein n=1 Tax=Fomitiporia mediterranea (strain MF3/22) TaxID=694068 RepID=UPI00044075DC|nr:ARM repeat-containing protein [Fomitiporia mediterranea MF3/22]EJD08526.1 ARM repeat-containing protein [Fomitiporia mediterranea MF3/22]